MVDVGRIEQLTVNDINAMAQTSPPAAAAMMVMAQRYDAIVAEMRAALMDAIEWASKDTPPDVYKRMKAAATRTL